MDSEHWLCPYDRCVRLAGLVLLLVAAGGMPVEPGPAHMQASSTPAELPAETQPAPARPVLVCDEPVYDFGTVWAGEVIEHEFEVKNVSPGTVWVRSRINRSGAYPSGPYKIHPQQVVRIPIKFSTKRMAGDQELKMWVRVVPPP